MKKGTLWLLTTMLLLVPQLVSAQGLEGALGFIWTLIILAGVIGLTGLIVLLFVFFSYKRGWIIVGYIYAAVFLGFGLFILSLGESGFGAEIGGYIIVFALLYGLLIFLHSFFLSKRVPVSVNTASTETSRSVTEIIIIAALALYLCFSTGSVLSMFIRNQEFSPSSTSRVLFISLLHLALISLSLALFVKRQKLGWLTLFILCVYNVFAALWFFVWMIISGLSHSFVGTSAYVISIVILAVSLVFLWRIQDPQLRATFKITRTDQLRMVIISVLYSIAVLAGMQFSTGWI
jgi:hypothetical protein